MSRPSTPADICDRALAMMRSLSIAPTPRNYALFFACASGNPPALLAEVETLIADKVEFSAMQIDRLYDAHLLPMHASAMQDSAATTKKILADMVMSLSQLTGTTHSVSAQMHEQLTTLAEGEADMASLQRMARIVIEGAGALKHSSDAVAEKLASAEREVAALRDNLSRVTEESEHDFLTGCHNRKTFDRSLAEIVKESATSEHYHAALLMIDVDHFKKFNDSFGHQVGDEVLKIVAKSLTDSVKGMDVVARFGGEEFAVILPKTPVGGGMIVAESIRKMIAGRELKRRSTGESYGAITVSIGVAALRSGKDTPESLIARADAALYRAKKSGRNRVVQEDLGAQ